MIDERNPLLQALREQVEADQQQRLRCRMEPASWSAPSTSARSSGKRGTTRRLRQGLAIHRRDSSMSRANRQDYSADVADETEGQGYDEQWLGRLPSSSRRYRLPSAQGYTGYTLHPKQIQRLPIPARRSALPPAGRTTEERAAPPRRRTGGLFRSHPLLWIGCGMLVMLLAWTGLQALGAWWSLHQDDVTYGRPRTAQYDVVVGHSDSASSPTHFIALNLDATVVVIELPGGDTSKARIYRGPQLLGPGANLYPVTLSFPDPTGNGQPNMEVHVQGETFLYLNQNRQFVPQVSSH